MKRKIMQMALLTLVLASLLSCTRSVSTMAGIGRDNGRDGENPSGDSTDGKTVCIDPGHGFDDGGTSSSLLGDRTEKEITLEIAGYLREALESRGFTVILTHDGAEFPETKIDDGNRLFNPQERISYLETLSVDYFVSLHCDSYPADSTVNGTRVYYSAGTVYTRKSKRAAEHICAALDEALPDRKETLLREMEKSKAYYVIRHATVPSSLIEVGFVTNPGDAADMCSVQWCQSIADGIAAGITDFFAD